MTHHRPPARPLRSQRAKPLKGTFRAPGDAALSHLALMAGTLALGDTALDGLLETEDVLQTVEALRSLGARIEKTRDVWHVHGLGSGGLLEPAWPLDFGAEGTAADLAIGLAAIYPFVTRFIGTAPLAQPLGPLLAPLRLMGVVVEAGAGERLPIVLHGPLTPIPIEYRLPEGAHRLKSALLFAALSITGTTRLIEPDPEGEDTENLLMAFGAKIAFTDLDDDSRAIDIAGLPDLRAQSLAVPCDPSLAAFGIVAALIVAGSDLLVENVIVDPERMGLLITLIEMGGDIVIQNRREIAGEEVADIRVRHARLRGADLPADRSGVAIADCPILAVAAAFAVGTTILPIAGETAESRIRLAVLVKGLQAAGVECDLDDGRLIIKGHGRVRGGGMIDTLNDDRIAMSMMVLGTGARDPVTITDDAAIATSFPGFIARFEDMGVRFAREI